METSRLCAKSSFPLLLTGAYSLIFNIYSLQGNQILILGFCLTCLYFIGLDGNGNLIIRYFGGCPGTLFYFISPNRFSYLYGNRMVSCSFIDWLFLSVRISFSNCGLNEFTRLNGQFSSGPSIRLFSKNVKPGM